MSTKTLNLKHITRPQLVKEWNGVGWSFKNHDLYIRCDRKGSINWDMAPVYEPYEIVNILLENKRKINIIE